MLLAKAQARETAAFSETDRAPAIAEIEKR